MKQQIKNDLEQILTELVEENYLQKNHLFVIGCSTSEVAGKHIGSSGSEEIASIIYEVLIEFQKRISFDIAIQCCEHLNRALCIERSTKEKYGLEEVTAIPVLTAGGALAAHAYQTMDDAVLVEHVKGDIGLDIGETLIGMQLKHVAVPLRLKKRSIHKARINAARTRPKLIGGDRAIYK